MLAEVVIVCCHAPLVTSITFFSLMTMLIAIQGFPTQLLFPLAMQTPARSAAFSPDGLHAVSAASGERQVAVWPTSPAAPGSKKSKKAQAAAAALSLEDAAVQVDTCSLRGGDADVDGNGVGSSGFHVAAVSECGEAYIWVCLPGAEGTLESRLLARVRVGIAPTKG